MATGGRLFNLPGKQACADNCFRPKGAVIYSCGKQLFYREMFLYKIPGPSKLKGWIGEKDL